jgi:hypothetical protein
LVSDTSAIYCGSGGSVIEVGNDGTRTTLGPLLVDGMPGAGLAFDGVDVYRADQTSVGTVMKAPKMGGTATVIARDTSPVAMAVDANAIYWSDTAGNIGKASSGIAASPYRPPRKIRVTKGLLRMPRRLQHVRRRKDSCQTPLLEMFERDRVAFSGTVRGGDVTP